MLASSHRPLILTILLAACASPTTAPTSTTANREATTVAESDPLQSEKNRVLAMRAPRYLGSGDKDDALSFLNIEVKEWLSKRKTATQSLCDRYLAASSAASPDNAAASLRNVSQLQLDFAREFIAAGVSAIPSSIRSDAELVRAYRGALVDAARAQLDAARQATTACLDRASRENPTRRECESLSLEIAALENGDAALETVVRKIEDGDSKH